MKTNFFYSPPPSPSPRATWLRSVMAHKYGETDFQRKLEDLLYKFSLSCAVFAVAVYLILAVWG